MLKKMTSALAASTFALTLIAAPAMAQTAQTMNNDYQSWDTDGTPGISDQEFRTGFENNEAFNTWDADDDGNLTENEFNTGLGDNRERFDARYGDSWFDDWDADDNDMINEDEYYGGLYDTYDADDNNLIEEPEFGDVGDDMGDEGWFDV